MPFIGNQPAKVPLTSADITDGIITSAKIADGTIVNADINSSAAIDFTKLSGVGITEADAWRINASITFTNPGYDAVTSNWERVDTDGFSLLGTGLTQSSGVFTFPSTGYWYINLVGTFSAGAARNYVGFLLYTTLNNSTYDQAALSYNGIHANSAYGTNSNSFIFKVTDTTNYKIKFYVGRSETVTLETDTNATVSGFTTIKIANV